MFRILRYTGSLLAVIFICHSSFAQNKFMPSAVRTGIDLTGIGYSIFGKEHRHYELNNDLQFGKYFFAFDLGTSRRLFHREVINEEFIYQYKGAFFRLGLDYNFIPNDPDNNVIFFGLRYGRAFFSDRMQFTYDDNRFGPMQDYFYENNDLTARWIEANAGMKIKVWNQLFLGYTLRLKFAAKIKGETNLDAYEIPGFGKSAKSSAFGFNYHLFYRFPF
ncbi:MAG: DUF6048 family protein [Bacteroidota bacterium]|nr:DUF6048 family protein [Bacteroidota bacterium]